MEHAQIPLVLGGSSYDRGRQHGCALRGWIRESIARWKATLPHEYQLEPEDVIERFLAATDFMPAIEAWSPGVLDEIRGIAEGADIGFEAVYVFQLLDELWNNSQAILGEHCTSIGAARAGEGRALVAQTIDVESFRDGYQVVLHIQDSGSGMQAFLVGSAGGLGFNGMNSRGIGVCCNGMLQVSSASTGLPVACVVRGILEQHTLQDAVSFVHRVPHASGQNYLVGSPEGVISLECSANCVVEIRPDMSSGVLGHTNHPLRTNDLLSWYRDALKSNDPHAFVVNSRARLSSLQRQLDAIDDVTVDRLQDVLRSKDDAVHPICSDGLPGELYAEYGLMTFAATIMDLSATPRLHVALGPPDRAPFLALGFQ